MTIRSFSLPQLVIGIMGSCLITGVASWVWFGWNSALDRAEIRGSLKTHDTQISLLAESQRELSEAQAVFLRDLGSVTAGISGLAAQISGLNKRFDDFLARTGDSGK